MPPLVNQALPGGTMLENYRIARQISYGGFSIVYLAYDEHAQPFAIKEYMPQFMPLRVAGEKNIAIPPIHLAAFERGLAYFFEEARVLSGLHHPNVMQVLNFFRANGTAYMVMPLERGRSLQAHIHAHRGTLHEDFIRQVFFKLLHGLAEVHRSGLLHLDLKPANIWLRTDNTPVILDFGAARFAVDIGTPLPRAMYTPGFAAPEQYHGNYTLGPWTDIYAIGACIYASLAKAAPPAADERLKDDRLQPARQRFSHLYSPALLIAIDQCLNLPPVMRPQNAQALQATLANATGTDKTAWLRKLRHLFQH